MRGYCKPEAEISTYEKVENLVRMPDNIDKNIKINKSPLDISMVKFKNTKPFRERERKKKNSPEKNKNQVGTYLLARIKKKKNVFFSRREENNIFKVLKGT